jgi:hypothetical protein
MSCDGSGGTGPLGLLITFVLIGLFCYWLSSVFT